MINSRVPPEPSISSFSQTVRFWTDPYCLMQEATEECGEIFRLRLIGTKPWVLISCPELLDELFNKPEEEVVAGPPRRTVAGFYLIGDRLSFAQDGEPYMRFRRVSAPLFSARGALKHTDRIRRLAESQLASWSESRRLSIQSSFDEISLRTTCGILLGPDDRPEIEALIALSARFVKALRSPWVWIPAMQVSLGSWTPWGRFLRLRRNLFEAFDRELQRRIDGTVEVEGDLMSAYLAAFESNLGAMRQAILEDLAGYLVGGSDTTAKMMCWTLFGLLKNRQAFDRLRQEIDEQLGDEPIGNENLKRLPYLRAVVQEGLRYRSPGPFAGPRQTVRDIDLGGFRIPESTIVAQCFSQTGRRRDTFPHPDRFEPNNFMERDVKMGQWLPFGGGHRICAGMGLAQLEIAVVIGTIVRAVDFELFTDSDQPSRSGVGFQPQDGLAVAVQLRST